MPRANAIVFARDLSLPNGAGTASQDRDLTICFQPAFNRALREIKAGAVTVRRYARVAKRQFHLLEQFESLSWAPRIVDILPENWDPQQRAQMKETVFRLNEGQDPWLIHFHCYCAQRAVAWEFRADAISNLLIPTDGDGRANEQRRPETGGRLRFDSDLGEFWVNKKRVASFASQAINLIAILKKFQAFGWPCKLRDPLGSAQSGKYGVWLKTAAHRLNRRQDPWLIEFHSHPRDRALSWRFRLA